MLWIFFLKFVFCIVQQLNKNELYSLNSQTLENPEIQFDTPFLIFIYFQKNDFVCPLCEDFKNSLANLSIPVRTLNFAENVELGSRFLQHTFPAFIIRHRNLSYVIDPESVEDLENIIKSGKWMNIKPVRKRMDVDSLFALIFGKINRVIFYVVTIIQHLSTIVPEYVITVFILCVISFLIYSIVDVLKTEDRKTKSE